jgi:hypothetical protein
MQVVSGPEGRIFRASFPGPEQAAEKLESQQFCRENSAQGLKPEPLFGHFGTTQSPQLRTPVAGDPDEVVPCYKTSSSASFSAACSGPGSLRKKQNRVILDLSGN